MIKSLRRAFTIHRTTLVVLFLSLLVLLFFLFTAPIPQDADYHQFADSRHRFGIAHGANVLSNFLFLVAGMLGLFYIRRIPIVDFSRSDQKTLNPPRTFSAARLNRMYWVFFLALIATGLGSAFYHLDPNNSRLVWDRLPMAVGFMSLFCIVIAEQLNQELAERAFNPLLVLGIFSVLYWHYTETKGMGDLRMYLLVQFLPIVCLPFLLIRASPFDARRHFGWVLGLYVIAKLFEAADGQIYAAGEWLGGHSIKHMVAGLGTMCIVWGFRCRAIESRAEGSELI